MHTISYDTFVFVQTLNKKHELDSGLAIIIKQDEKIDRMDLVGTVDGCDAIIVDDLIDTAGKTIIIS